MSFEITILGNNSAIPAHGRHPSSQAVHIHDKIYLVDCGESTQIQLVEYKIKWGRIQHIFISHLHGDHFFGLIGLLTTLNLLKREKELNIYGPAELKNIIEIQLNYTGATLNYKINFFTIKAKQPEIIFESNDIMVETILMNHRVPCVGFLFKEKKIKRKVLPEKIREYNIPVDFICQVAEGNDFKDDQGNIVKNDWLTSEPSNPLIYAYCTDTLYNEQIIPQIRNADLLYHEATFGNDSAQRAAETFHSTAEQAATLAKKAEVKKLIIGHFSAKYENVNILLEEAKNIFDNTELALEGKKFLLNSKL